MDRAAQAYAAENFAKAAQLLESAGALHPGNLAIGCNLGLTRYQQGNRDEALALLDECVAAMRDKDTRRQIGGAGHRAGHRRSAERRGAGRSQQVARLNDAILPTTTGTTADDDDDDGPAAPAAGLCAQMKQLQAGLPKNPALLFNLAKCAESDGRLDDATDLLTEYGQAAPTAADIDEVQARLVVLKSLSALPEPQGAAVRQPIRSAGKHVEARDTIWRSRTTRRQTRPSRSSWRASAGSRPCWRRRGRSMRARTYWQQVSPPRPARKAGSRRSCSSMDWTRRKASTTSWSARPARSCTTCWDAACSRENLSAGSTRRTGCSSPTTRSSPPTFCFPLAPEANLLQAFTCSQMNDFRCVRASFDAQRSLTLPVSFYGAVFYKGVEPKKRAKQERTYGEVRVREGHVRFAEISTVKPKKRQRRCSASPAQASDRLGRLGAADGLRSGRLSGVHRPGQRDQASGNARRPPVPGGGRQEIKHRKMLIEPLSLRARGPPAGPGRAALHEQLHQHRGDLWRGRKGQAREGVHDRRREAEDGLQHRVDRDGRDVGDVRRLLSVIDVATGVGGLAQKIGLIATTGEAPGDGAAAGVRGIGVQGHPNRAGQPGVPQGPEIVARSF